MAARPWEDWEKAPGESGKSRAEQSAPCPLRAAHEAPRPPQKTLFLCTVARSEDSGKVAGVMLL